MRKGTQEQHVPTQHMTRSWQHVPPAQGWGGVRSLLSPTPTLVLIHQWWQDDSLAHQASPCGNPCSLVLPRKTAFHQFLNSVLFLLWVSSAHSLVQAFEWAENELQMGTERNRMLLFVQDPLCTSLTQNAKHSKSWQETVSLHCTKKNTLLELDTCISIWFLGNQSWMGRHQVWKQIN